jgi:NAD+ synthase
MDYQEEIEKIAQWMKDYAKEAGAKGFVVGLSGGIDSSVIACLAVKAVGKDNVVGISLPCQTRQDMKDDAVELAENLGITFEQVFLDETFEALIKGLFASDKVKILTLANVKARLRMSALYAVANQNNYLVAGTGNKSELMVGYFTKFGDGGVDMEPLGEYYKSEVYKMAELMSEIPEGPKTKAPSADLYEGQTDEQELGITYDQLEKILKRYEQGEQWMDLYAELDGITEEEFIKVRAMVKKSIHKNEVPIRYER